jgi:NADPH-dependent 2,4-dienoyl-CoA reductase/sulfur reductase-like enzyme
MRRLLIVGASLAGHRAAKAARGAGFTGDLIVVGEERHPPYTRPPLSKELLAGEQEPDRVHFPCDKFEADWRLGVSAVSLDRGRRRVVLSDGDELSYDRLILATGSRARSWPGSGADLEGVHVLRNLDDALTLRAAFDGRPRVAIVGAGFIGCEVAQTARKRGLDSDGERIAADVVVVGLGAVPNTEWLDGSGLRLSPGLECDATLTAVDDPDILGGGDIVSWPHPLAGGEALRIEHWTVAAEQGQLAGRNVLTPHGERKPYDAPPYFWSDQYDKKIQSLGLPGRAERLEIVEATPDGKRVVYAGERDGRLVGIVAINAARRLGSYRMALAEPPAFDDLRATVAADPAALHAPPKPA